MLLSNTFKQIIVSTIALVCIILIGLLASHVLAVILNILTFFILLNMHYRYASEKSEESKSTINKLELELSKLTTIDRIQNEKNIIQQELERTTSYNHHLAGIISGLNHELSPWITGIYIAITRMQESETDPKHIDTLHKIEMATIQTSELLSNLSKNINKIKNFSVFRSNVKDTVNSWIQIVLLERSIKDKISDENIIVNLDSLNFVANHSPMYLSQIILNLVKNSIDHNSHMLENLKIRIYGDIKSKYLIYEDNGKGIPKEILDTVFKNFGVTTKKLESGEIHGFGLYSCLNYCLSMKAIIIAQSMPNEGTRFIIKFERIDENNEVDISTDGVFTK